MALGKHATLSAENRGRFTANQSHPIFAGGGACVLAQRILGYLASDYDPEQTIAEFPDLNREHIAACLDYARELAEFEVTV